MSRTYTVRKYASICEAAYNLNRATAIIDAVVNEQFNVLVKNDIYILVRFNSEFVICFRGTKLTSPSNITDDLLVLAGLLHLSNTIIVKARLIVMGVLNLIKNKEPNMSLVLTGHSLGGSIVRELAGELWHELKHCYLFNEGMGASFLKTSQPSNKITGYFIRGDPISFLAQNLRTTNRVLDKRGNLNAHTIRQFY